MTLTAIAAADDDQNPSTNPAPKRRQTVENKDFDAFTRRILRAYSRRVANGDIEALPQMIDLAASLNDAINGAVGGLREFGYSWPEIASRVGVSRQAARQRWGAKEDRFTMTSEEAALFPLDFFGQVSDDYA